MCSSMKIIVVGNGKVGKTTLTIKYVKGKFTTEYKIEKKEITMYVTEEFVQLTFKINIMNCKDFTLELTKKKDDLNSSVQSLCTTVIQLKEDNKKLEKENSQFRNEIIELKAEIENKKQEQDNN